MKRIVCIGIIFFAHYDFCMQEAPAAAAAADRVIKLLASDGQVECPAEFALQSSVIKAKLDFQESTAQAVEDEFELRDFSQKELLRCVDYLEKCVHQASPVQAYSDEDLSTNIRMLTLADFLDIESLRTLEVKEIENKLSLLKNLDQFGDNPLFMNPLLSIPDVAAQTFAQRLPVVYFSRHPFYSNNNRVFSPDDRTMVICNDSELRLLNVATGDEICRVPRGCAPTFSPDGRMLAIRVIADGRLGLLNVATGEEICRVPDSHQFTFSPNSRIFAINKSDGRLRLFNVATGEEIFVAMGEAIYSIPGSCAPTFSPDGHIFATKMKDKLSLLNITTGEELCRVPCDSKPAFSPDSRTLAIKMKDGRLRLLNVATGEETCRILDCDYHMFSPDSRILVITMFADKRLRLLSVATGDEICRVPGGSSFTFSPNSRTLAVFIPNEWYLFDAATGKELRRIPGDSARPPVFYSGLLSKDEKKLSLQQEVFLRLLAKLQETKRQLNLTDIKNWPFLEVFAKFNPKTQEMLKKNFKIMINKASPIEQQAHINGRDAEGRSVLCRAVLHNELDLVRSLLARGVDVNGIVTMRRSPECGYTPLHAAVRNKHESLGEYLMEHGADVHAKDAQGWAPLHTAAMQNLSHMVVALLKHGAHIDEKTKQQETPLHIALDNKHESLARYLMLYGADINAKDAQKWSCFDYAVSRDLPSIVDELVRRGCSVGGDSELIAL